MVLTRLREVLNDKALERVEQVQSLWSGYGEIARYYSPLQQRTFIVKHISPPEEIVHPRGWNTQISHQRKLTSYQIEQHFYAQYSDRCDVHCKTAAWLGTFAYAGQPLMILEDLDGAGFAHRVSEYAGTALTSALDWLAAFHAQFMGEQGAGLWDIGTYWHLSTRQDEWQSMLDGALKQHACAIDDTLRRARFTTLVHGDAKLANFCFSEDRQHVAAVDFQYVGKGIGVVDVMYLLGCCLNSTQLGNHAQEWLAYYFRQLQGYLGGSEYIRQYAEIEREWRQLLPYAWADFQRFLQGWSPGHWKINSYMQSQTDIVLQSLAKPKAP